MNNINLIPINAKGSLNNHLPNVKKAFTEVIKIAVKDLNVKNIDILIFDYPEDTIKELGIGGRTFNANLIYINLNPKFNIKYQEILATMYHELHHAARFSSIGYGETLLESLLSEGLACLYEEEKTGKTPIYVKSKLSKQVIDMASKELQSKKYNHIKWFVSGDKQIPKWFGYSYGYYLAKEASKKLNKTSNQLVSNSAKTLYSASLK